MKKLFYLIALFGCFNSLIAQNYFHTYPQLYSEGIVSYNNDLVMYGLSNTNVESSSLLFLDNQGNTLKHRDAIPFSSGIPSLEILSTAKLKVFNNELWGIARRPAVGSGAPWDFGESAFYKYNNVSDEFEVSKGKASTYYTTFENIGNDKNILFSSRSKPSGLTSGFFETSELDFDIPINNISFNDQVTNGMIPDFTVYDTEQNSADNLIVGLAGSSASWANLTYYSFNYGTNTTNLLTYVDCSPLNNSADMVKIGTDEYLILSSDAYTPNELNLFEINQNGTSNAASLLSEKYSFGLLDQYDVVAKKVLPHSNGYIGVATATDILFGDNNILIFNMDLSGNIIYANLMSAASMGVNILEYKDAVLENDVLYLTGNTQTITSLEAFLLSIDLSVGFDLCNYFNPIPFSQVQFFLSASAVMDPPFVADSIIDSVRIIETTFVAENLLPVCVDSIPPCTPFTVISNVSSPISCTGECDGWIYFEAIFSTPNTGTNYTYTIEGANGIPLYPPLPYNLNGPNFEINLCADTYTIIITGDDSCTASSTILLDDGPICCDSITINIDITNMDADCGMCNGIINAVATGGTPSYTYTLIPSNGNPPNNTGVFQNLCQGIYTVQVLDNQGCMATIVSEIIETDEQLVSYNTIQNTTINGLGNLVKSSGGNSWGAANVGRAVSTQTVSNGQYIEWPINDVSTIGQSSIMIGLSYTVVPTGTYSSIDYALYFLNANYQVWENGSLNNLATNVSNGDILKIARNNGFIEYYINDVLVFSTPEIDICDDMTVDIAMYYENSTLEDLLIGGCEAEGCDTICDVVASVASITNVSCFGNCDGAIDIDVTAGTPPYSYLWSINETTQDISNLCPGMYDVTVTDADGCQTTLFDIFVGSGESCEGFFGNLTTDMDDYCLDDPITFTITSSATIQNPVTVFGTVWSNGNVVEFFNLFTVSSGNESITIPTFSDWISDFDQEIECGEITIILEFYDNENPELACCTDQVEYTINYSCECDVPPLSDCWAANDNEFENLNVLFGGDAIIDQSDDTNGDGIIVLNGKYYVPTDMSVENVILDITNCDLVFEECTGLLFGAGSALRANNSVFRTCDSDDIWRGLLFANNSVNLVNECTFKNATIALVIVATDEDKLDLDIKIENNLFQNCHIGAMFSNFNEGITKTYNYPIVGNSFVFDQDAPSLEQIDICYAGTGFLVPNFSTGILSSRSKFTGQIAQNTFVNNKHVNSFGIVGGVLLSESEGAKISENTFTDMIHSVGVVGSSGFFVIENNEIEVSRTFPNGSAQILVSESRAEVSIVGNEINTTFTDIEDQNRFQAIEVSSADNVEIINNSIIGGFTTGIFAERANNITCSSNNIENFQTNGIRYFRVTNGIVTCNTIDGNNIVGAQGIVVWNRCTDIDIYSNCVLNTNHAIRLNVGTGFDGSSIDIRDNFLFNYRRSGIFNNGFANLRIGWNAQNPGQNTFWSNDNSAFDIRSNTTITTAFDNFGLSNFSTLNIPNLTGVVIESDSPEYSTAGCGQQVLGETSQQDNLNRIFECAYPSENWVAEFEINEEMMVVSEISDQKSRYESVSSTYSRLYNYDVVKATEWFDAIISDNSLDSRYTNLLKYQNAQFNGNYVEALAHLDNVDIYEVEEEYWSLFANKLILQDEVGVLDINNLSSNVLEELQEIATVEHSATNTARIILMNHYGQSHIYINKMTDELVEDVTDGPMTRLSEEITLDVYPNPGNGLISVQVTAKELDGATLTMYDARGKLIQSQAIQFVSGAATFDVSKIASGIYMLSINDGKDFVATKKFVKL